MAFLHNLVDSSANRIRMFEHDDQVVLIQNVRILKCFCNEFTLLHQIRKLFIKFQGTKLNRKYFDVVETPVCKNSKNSVQLSLVYCKNYQLISY